jgi:hypothetical protein
MTRTLVHLRVPFVCVILGFAILACGIGGTTSAGPTPTATLTPTALQRCQLAVPGSTAVSGGGAAFANIPFRPDSTSKVVTTVGGGAGQFTVTTYTICAPNSAAADIAPFHAAQMPANGWASSPDFPTDGQLHQPCASPCWHRDSKTRKATVASPAAGSVANTATYQLVLAAPPPIPVAACRVNEYSPSTPTEFTTSFGPDIPLPPLSTQTLAEGVPGISQAIYCSAGNTASVNAFFGAALPTKGWALGSLPAAKVPSCASGGTPVSGWVKGGDHLLKFTIPSGGPAYAVGFKWQLTVCTSDIP